MMMETRSEVLTLEQLKQPEWMDRAEHLLQLTYQKETGEQTVESEAQEMFLQFVKNMGGIRADVYEYLLLSPRFHDVAEVTAAGMLLCYGAPLEWIKLVLRAFEKNRVSGALYANEITEAYKEGVPVEQVSNLLNETKTIFEFCQKRLRNDYSVAEDRWTAETSALEKERLEEIIISAVHTAMETFEEREKKFKKVNEEPENQIFQEAGKVIEEVPEEREEAKVQTEVPEQDMLSRKTLVFDLEKVSKEHDNRVSFFEILLNRHMKRMFEKLDKETQIGKIFEIMVEKKYKKEKILAIKRLMNGGMTNEFIFSLIEKDISEEELNELCETLVEDMPQSTFNEHEQNMNVEDGWKEKE